ncbi:ATP-dependent DNA helicase chl1, partial [Ascosphaera atra]
VKLPPSIPDEDEAEDSCVKTHETLRHVPLGSRKTLCVNPKVASLNNPTAINERCLELQRPGTAAEHRCPYLPSKDDEALVNEFRDHTLAKVRDIEDIGKLGKKMGLCPYYASRSALPQSEIITLPYPLLLQKTAREALNISLKDHVIIIDEAHNLIDAISNIFTTSVSMSQLQTALGQLTAYARRYQNRLAGKNRMYITQVIRLVQSLAAYLRGVLEQQGAKDGVARLSDLMVGKGVDLINPHKLSRYLHESKLARKVDGLVEHEAKKASKDKGGGEHRPSQRSTMPVLFQIQSFIISLMNPSKEGKLFYEKGQDGDVLLRYLLLDPTEHFREVVEDARAVILAGGTMSPVCQHVQVPCDEDFEAYC